MTSQIIASEAACAVSMIVLTRELKVNIKEIDDQHQELISLINFGKFLIEQRRQGGK